MGILFPDFRKKNEGQSELPEPAVSKVLLIQNNQCSKVAYFGVTHSDFLQYLTSSILKNNTNSHGFFRCENSENYKAFWCFTFMSYTLLVLG